MKGVGKGYFLLSPCLNFSNFPTQNRIYFAISKTFSFYVGNLKKKKLQRRTSSQVEHGDFQVLRGHLKAETCLGRLHRSLTSIPARPWVPKLQGQLDAPPLPTTPITNDSVPQFPSVHTDGNLTARGQAGSRVPFSDALPSVCLLF